MTINTTLLHIMASGFLTKYPKRHEHFWLHASFCMQTDGSVYYPDDQSIKTKPTKLKIYK